MSGRRWLIFIAVLIGGALMVRTVNNDYVREVDDALVVVEASNVSGWVEDANTWTYSSADAPSFVISINADVTGYLSAGMRVRYTQTTVKYGIITAVGSYSAGATLVTIYGGTDYTLANAAISSPGYSSYKAPFGFPLNRDKWTVEKLKTSNTTQSSPAANTWYNAETIIIPIGVWDVDYKILLATNSSGTQYSQNIYSTLSTGASSESNTHMIDGFSLATYDDIFSFSFVLRGSDVIVASSKTTYYLNFKTLSTVDGITVYGDTNPTIIRAVCAYL